MKRILIVTLIFMGGCTQSQNPQALPEKPNPLIEEARQGWPSWPRLNYRKPSRLAGLLEQLRQKENPATAELSQPERYTSYVSPYRTDVTDYENLLILQDRLARQRQEDLLLRLQLQQYQPRFDYDDWLEKQQRQLHRWEIEDALERIESELFFQRQRGH